MNRTITKSLGDGKTIEIPDPEYYNEDNKFVKFRKKITNFTPKKKKKYEEFR